MKPSFKTTILIATIGMIVYALYVVARYTFHVLFPAPYHYELWNDIYERLVRDILPVSLIVAGFGLYKQRPVNITKHFRILTICLLVALGGTLFFSPIYTYWHSIWPPFFWRIILLIAGISWLFMLRNQLMENVSSHFYRITLIFAIVLLALPMILEAISGIAILCENEFVLGLHSGAIKTWVKYIAPILPMVFLITKQKFK